MGSTYIVSRKTSKQIIKYRAIKYKFHGKWKEEILGQSDLIQKGYARRILQKREKAIALGNYGIIENDVPTLSEFIEEYITHKRDVDNKRSWKKDQTFLNKFVDHFSEIKLCDITTKQIDEYKLERMKSLRQKYRSFIRSDEGKAIKMVVNNLIGSIPILGNVYSLGLSAYQEFIAKDLLHHEGALLFIDNQLPTLFEDKSKLIRNNH